MYTEKDKKRKRYNIILEKKKEYSNNHMDMDRKKCKR